MSGLLVLKQRLKELYASYQGKIVPVVRGLIALFMILAINDRIGFVPYLNNFLVVILLTVLCAALPTVAMLCIGCMLVLLHLAALSTEIALIAAAVFVVMILLYLRFCSKQLLLLILVPLSFYLGIPYIMPLVIGILCGPGAILTLVCGIIIHFYIDYISVNALAIQEIAATDSMSRIRTGLDAIIHNEALTLALISFVVATIVVYVLRKQAIDQAFSTSIFAGAIVNVILNFIGILILDNGPGVLGLLLGSVIAVPVAILIAFLFVGLDYSRTERVQFEDDDYYYYVKAVPKMNIQSPTKTVKRINTQRYHSHYK